MVSPAAHSTSIRPSLAHESCAIRGRVHAVVMPRLVSGTLITSVIFDNDKDEEHEEGQPKIKIQEGFMA